MKTFPEFGERYEILPLEKSSYVIYDKESPSKRSVHKYIGNFEYSRGTYMFHGHTYYEPDDLIRAMHDYAESLPFSIENYNPLYRKHVLIEFCIQDYLTELGFTWNRYSFNHECVYEFIRDSNRLCRLVIYIEDDTTCGSITRELNDKTWQEVEFNDLDSAIAAINSLISICFLSINVETASVLSKLTKSRASCILMKQFDINTFQTFVHNITDNTIKYLEKELKLLKKENE